MSCSGIRTSRPPQTSMQASIRLGPRSAYVVVVIGILAAALYPFSQATSVYIQRRDTLIRQARATFFGAEIVWVAVTVDTKTKTFCAYTGDVDTSKPPLPKYIPMHPNRDVCKHDCLARDVFDEEISASWSKIEQTVRGNKAPLGGDVP